MPRLIAALLLLCVTSAVSMLFPLVLGKVIDTAKTGEDDKPQTTIAGIPMPATINIFSHEIPTTVFYYTLAGIFLVGAIANFGRVVLLRQVGERIMMNLRVDILRNMFYQTGKFWDTHKTGDLISRLVNDSTVVSRAITQNLSNGLRSFISGFVGMVMMVTISAKLTAYMFLIFPVLVVLAMVFGRRIKKISKKIQWQLGNLTKVSEEQFNFVKTIQSFNNEKYEVHRFGNQAQKLYDLSVFEGKLNGIFFGSNAFIGNTFLLFMLSLGTYMVRQGDLTLGELSSYLMFTTYSATSVYSLSNFYSELQKGVGASGRIFELLRLKPAIDPQSGSKLDVNGDIVFHDICFRYPTRQNHQVFNDLNLTIKRGTHVCLVGPSGCGKSTIVQMLLRYYAPMSGAITLNDHNLEEVNLENYRRQVGIVQQEPMLFSGTIRENIVYGRRDVDEKDIWKVVKLAHCEEFVRGFTDGLDTVVGTKGAQLSGGQKQRIALARTLLLGTKIPEGMAGVKDDLVDESGDLLLGPSILILDEATSALDVRSEEAIKNTLRLRESAGLTTISIAHRLSTIQMSDRVIVFSKDGKIIETGSYDQLYKDPASKFSELVKKEPEQITVHKF